jgi:hypothetical protein
MSSITFTNTVTHIPADWANDADALIYDIFGGAQTVVAARSALGIGSMALQNATAVSIAGGAIDNVNIGQTTPANAKFSNAEVINVGGGAQAVPNKGYVDAGLSGISSSLGTMAAQNSNSVVVTGGTINGATIGATVPTTGAFTSLVATAVPANPTDVVNKSFLDAQWATLPVFGNIVTQNSGSISLTGGTINSVVIGGVTPAAGSFTAVVGQTYNGQHGTIELDATTALNSGVYLESAVAKPDITAQLGSGGYFDILDSLQQPVARFVEATRALVVGPTVDNGVDILQVGGSITGTIIKLSGAITLANQGATKQYVDTQIATVPGLIAADIASFAATLGTMAVQDANNVAITGGAMDGVVIGASVPQQATFTTVNAIQLTDATSSLVTLNGSGSVIVGCGLMLKATTGIKPNVVVEPGVAGAFVVKGGLTPAMQVQDTGRTLLNQTGDDGSSILQMTGNLNIIGEIVFNGPTASGAQTANLGTTGPMTTLTPTWIRCKIGGVSGVIPFWPL